MHLNIINFIIKIIYKINDLKNYINILWILIIKFHLPTNSFKKFFQKKV